MGESNINLGHHRYRYVGQRSLFPMGTPDLLASGNGEGSNGCFKAMSDSQPGCAAAFALASNRRFIPLHSPIYIDVSKSMSHSLAYVLYHF